MSKLINLSVAILLFWGSGFALAQTSNPSTLFNQGTEHYLKKDYKKAQELLNQALDLDPDNSRILTNLALTEFQLGNKPHSVGLLRKALASDPELPTANAGLKFILPQLQIREVPRQIEFYESLRQKVLQPVPLLAYLVLSSLSFFAAGWVVLSYFGRRKRALLEEKALPPVPAIGLLLSLSFVIFTGLLALKVYDSSMTRGTIVVEKVSLQTAPGDNQASIMDLYGGMEVLAKAHQGDWVQVTYPGSLTGWIKKSSVLMTR